MRRQFLIEFALIVSLLASTSYTIVVAPGIPSSRPWILPVALGAMAAGVLGLVVRSRGRGRLAGACYCLAALAPNGLYVTNVLVLAAGIAALAGVAVGRKRKDRDNLRTEHEDLV
jgi:hypothetical protein